MGLADNVVLPYINKGVPAPAVAAPLTAAPPVAEQRRYLMRSCRSVIGNQPYDKQAPWITFIQQREGKEPEERATFLHMGEVRAHRSVLEWPNMHK